MSLLDDGIQIASGSLKREPEQFDDPPCSRCYERDADYLCRECGRFVCSVCGTVVGGKTMCEQCVPIKEESMKAAEIYVQDARGGMSGDRQQRMMIAALKRAVTVLQATRDFIEANPVKDYVVFYDEAECDASCLSDDCGHTITEIQWALARIKDEAAA
jgi:hypothetical protein